jgi:hypothetical protein
MRSFLLAVVFLFSAGAIADAPASAPVALKDASFLRKLSFHLRGQSPDPAEYTALKEAQRDGTAKKYLDAKVTEYLAAKGHVEKMTFRLEELFRLRPGTNPVQDETAPRTPVPYEKRNALNLLFRSLAAENLSWDTLLTGKSYSLFPKLEQDFMRISDLAFMYSLAPTVLPPPGKDRVSDDDGLVPIALSFKAADTRIAGALTTSRFFGRYGTTELNKNRRRAAAVFDIFLCDPMAAVVPPPPSDKGPIADKAFPDTSRVTEDEIRRMTARGDKHGTDMACAQCHYKLDPMGQTFLTSPFTLSPIPSAGRLVYKDKKTGVLVDRPGLGLGEVAQAITEQRAYVDCQVGYFWKWFIGSDRELTDARRAQLVKAFNDRGRKTNDFIAYLVREPEFRQLDLRTPTQIRADGIKTIMKNCTSCHSAKIPDFASWPIGGDPTKMRYWVDRIAVRMDLSGDGANRTMPPAWSSWQPSNDEMQKLKAWIKDGAPNESGDPQL